MKFINKYYNTSFDQSEVKRLSEKFCISQDVIKILLGRGIDNEEQIDRFLNPSEDKLKNPLEIFGMLEAKERIEQAINNGERILIFGDYDVDGITAVSVLVLYLSQIGVDVTYFIPDRKNFGYGLSEKAIEYIAENSFPDLIITVDCGITSNEEVELIKNLGMDIIVTDHHEPPQSLPNCICVNTKLSESFETDPLCGCGTAFYLAMALKGSFPHDLVDLAALATVADMVPLLGDNRILVQLGLKKINNPETKRKCLEILMNESGIKGEIDETVIGFTIAPRINSLGRLSNAGVCVELFLTEDQDRMREIAKILLEENSKRQQLTFSYFDLAADNIIKDKLYNKRFISVCDKEFSNGINGLVASQIVNKFYRPAFVFSSENNLLTGSIRSVKGVDVVDLLTSMEDILVRFGGHSMAGGVTLEKDNYDEFLIRVENYLNKLPVEIFEERLEFDIDFSGRKLTIKEVEEIQKLSPFGICNPKPIFLDSIGFADAELFKKDSKHIRFKKTDVDFIYFNAEKALPVFNSDFKKQLLFELKINNFRNHKSITATVKAYKTDNSQINDADDYKYLRQLLSDSNIKVAEFKTETEFSADLKQSLKSYFSTIILVNTSSGLEFLKSTVLGKELYSKLDFCVNNVIKGNNNTILFLPEQSADLTLFDNVFIIERPLGDFINKNHKFSCGANIRVCNFIPKEFINKLSLERNIFIDYYKLFINNIELISGDDFEKVLIGLKKIDKMVCREQCYFCFLVFIELKIFGRKAGSDRLIVDKSVKVDLASSKVYQGIKKVKEK